MKLKFSAIFAAAGIALSLSASPGASGDFKTALSKVDQGGEVLQVQASNAEYLRYYNSLPDRMQSPKDLQFVILKRLHKIMGVPYVKANALSSKEVTPGCWVFKSYSYLGKENMRIPSVFTLAGSNRDLSGIGELPADTVLAFAFYCDAEKLYKLIKSDFSSAGEQFAQLFTQLENAAAQQKIDLNAVLKSFNGIVNGVIAGNSLNDLRILIEIPDKTGAIAGVLRNLFRLPANAKEAQIPLFFIPARLSFRNGYIKLSNVPDNMMRSGAKLGSLPKFKNYLTAVGRTGNGFLLLNLSAPLINNVKGVIPQEISGFVDIEPFSLLLVSKADADGSALVAASNFSITKCFTEFIRVPVVAGMLLPALNAARERARVAQCISHVKQITTAMFMYESDHQKFPEENGIKGLQKLIDNEYCQIQVFYCPSGKATPGNKLSADCPYIYIGGAFPDAKNVNAPSIPVVFSKPGIHQKSVVVGFRDGHVESLNINNYTNPTQVIGILNNRYSYSPEVLDKLLRAVAEN